MSQPIVRKKPLPLILLVLSICSGVTCRILNFPVYIDVLIISIGSAMLLIAYLLKTPSVGGWNLLFLFSIGFLLYYLTSALLSRKMYLFFFIPEPYSVGLRVCNSFILIGLIILIIGCIKGNTKACKVGSILLLLFAIRPLIEIIAGYRVIYGCLTEMPFVLIAVSIVLMYRADLFPQFGEKAKIESSNQAKEIGVELKTLKQRYEDGTISEEEYTKKRKEIINKI